MRIFVINICDERWERYKNDPLYTRWEGCIGSELSASFVDRNYITMWNSKRSHKHNVAGCSESHLSLLKHIYENKINDCIILEDDVSVDMSRLDELKNIDEFCYIGGHFQAPVLKQKLDIGNISFQKGLNTIDTTRFTIAGGYGLYIPKHQIAEWIHTNIMNRNKRRGYDCELRRLQKAGKLKKFIYPAMVELYLPVAKTGFSCQTHNFSLNDSKKYY